MIEHDDGLIWALLLNGKGGARTLAPAEMNAPPPEGCVVWLHWDRKSEGVVRWLHEQSGLDDTTCQALLAEETRPRSVRVNGALFSILRGVNLNEGAEPEDMVSVRSWMDERRIITLRGPRVKAIRDVRDRLDSGKGPLGPGDFLATLSWRLLERMRPVLEGLDEDLDNMEEQVVDAQSQELRRRLGELRRQAIGLRRYLAPQRDVLARFETENVAWLRKEDRARLREAADRLARYVEDLDALRERAAVTQEELTSRFSEQMNRTMYILSLVAAVFLPLGLLTGLLGINVGGMPGTDSNWAFAIVCAILILLAGAGVWAFRRLRLF